jgi:hypothetical protein
MRGRPNLGRRRGVGLELEVARPRVRPGAADHGARDSLHLRHVIDVNEKPITFVEKDNMSAVGSTMRRCSPMNVFHTATKIFGGI